MDRDSWQTPQYLFDWLDDKFHFKLDAASSPKNALCDKYYTKKDNGLNLPWITTTFCNPPYSKSPVKNLESFTKKAYYEALNNGITSVLVVPFDITGWFRDWVAGKASIIIPDERIAFINPETGQIGKSPAKGTMILSYSPRHPITITTVHIPKDYKKGATA